MILLGDDYIQAALDSSGPATPDAPGDQRGFQRLWDSPTQGFLCDIDCGGGANTIRPHHARFSDQLLTRFDCKTRAVAARPCLRRPTIQRRGSPAREGRILRKRTTNCFIFVIHTRRTSNWITHFLQSSDSWVQTHSFVSFKGFNVWFHCIAMFSMRFRELFHSLYLFSKIST